MSITFHRAGEQVIVAGSQVGKLLQVGIYSKDGEFVHCVEIAIDGGIRFKTRITVTTKGRIIIGLCCKWQGIHFLKRVVKGRSKK